MSAEHGPELWIVIPKWDRFQHYRDRNPPWVKIYTELLHNEDYLRLTGDQRAILHGLWLEYASSHARLRADTRSLSSRLLLRVTTRQLEALNHAGFIHFSASKPLAERLQDASASRAREEAEADREALSAKAKMQMRLTPLATTPTRNGEAQHPDFEQILQQAQAAQTSSHSHEPQIEEPGI